MIRKAVLGAVLAVAAVCASAIPAYAASHNHAKTVKVQLTGYSWQDNTPPNSARICCGVVHSHAGGTGTYSSPITVAVAGAGNTMQYATGTRFYSPKLRRYLIVEDSGAANLSHPHLDVWVDGQGLPRSYSDKCMSDITGTTHVIVNPDRGEPVTSGPLTSTNGDGCRL